MTDRLNALMDQLLQETKGWPEQARIDHIRPRIEAEYQSIQAQAEAAYKAKWEARYGASKPNTQFTQDKAA